MIQQQDTLTTSRGPVLVASASDSFQDILGQMIGRCGLAAARCPDDEPASLSLTRTQPCLVICDGDLPETAVSGMVMEVAARRIPLLVSTPDGASARDDGALPGVRRISFPVGQRAFDLLVGELLERSSPGTVVMDESQGKTI